MQAAAHAALAASVSQDVDLGVQPCGVGAALPATVQVRQERL
jgi:hypothetical protein